MTEERTVFDYLDEAKAQLNVLNAAIEDVIDALQANDLDLMDGLDALRELKLDLERPAKKSWEALRDERKRYEVHWYSYMRDRPKRIGSMKVGEKNFVPSETLFATVQDRSEFVEWAQEYAPELIQVEAREAEINRIIRERIDNNEPLPPGLGFYPRQTISIQAA